MRSEQWDEASREQDQAWQNTLQSHDAILGRATRQDKVTCPRVIFPVHPGNCHEVWELP